MTRFLVSDTNPSGHRLEDILYEIRNDILVRCGKIKGDRRPEAEHVLHNNLRILTLINEAMHLAEDSTRVLDRSFGPSHAAVGGAPRIGEL